MRSSRKCFKSVTAILGKSHIDLFASFLNANVSQYYSWKPDPGAICRCFTVSWHGSLTYCFPPFSLLDKCLLKINGTDRNHCCHANVANSAIQLPSNENVSASTTTATQNFMPADTTVQSQQSTSTSTKTSTTGMQVIERYLESKNIYEKAADIILSFWRTGTQKQYTTHINK